MHLILRLRHYIGLMKCELRITNYEFPFHNICTNVKEWAYVKAGNVKNRRDKKGDLFEWIALVDLPPCMQCTLHIRVVLSKKLNLHFLFLISSLGYKIKGISSKSCFLNIEKFLEEIVWSLFWSQGSKNGIFIV